MRSLLRMPLRNKGSKEVKPEKARNKKAFQPSTVFQKATTNTKKVNGNRILLMRSTNITLVKVQHS